MVPKDKYLDDLGVSNLGDLVDYKDTKALFGSAGSVTKIIERIDPSGKLLKTNTFFSVNDLELEKKRLQDLENYVTDNAAEWLNG